MTDEAFKEREFERAKRLLEYVKGELLAMYVEARFQFTIDTVVYLTPEIKCLLRDKRISVPDEGYP